MTVNRFLRLIAGFFVMLSVALAHFHNPTGCGSPSRRRQLVSKCFTDWCQ